MKDDVTEIIDNIPEMDVPYPLHWPPEEFYVRQKDATIEELQKLIYLIDRNTKETEIDKYITEHPSLLTFLMSHPDYSTGHHNSWVIPKKTIRTRKYTADKGEIPDFLIAGTDSGGTNWFVVELKGADSKIFSTTNKRIYFSPDTNKGLNQIMEYLLTLDRDQGHLRAHKLMHLSHPKGILVIGREKELTSNERKQQLKSGWNASGRIKIRTFDLLKRTLEERIQLIKNPPEPPKWSPLYEPIKENENKK